MTVKIKIEDNEIKLFLEKLNNLKNKPSNLLKDIGQLLVATTKERFTTQTNPKGGKWQSLSPRYLAKKRKQGFGDRILSRSGALRNSIRYQIEGTNLVIGSDQVYAATHQFGSRIKNIPARPYLGLSKFDEEAISTIFLEALSD